MSKANKYMAALVLLVAFAVGGYLAFQPAFGAGAYLGIPYHFGQGFSGGELEEFQVNDIGEINQTASSSFATTTVRGSFDGFTAGGGITPSSLATGTVVTLYTHTGGNAICDASTAALYADSTGYSPNLTISVGTSTTAAASTNLVASSTLSTTTDAVVAPNASLFVLAPGDKITALLSDGIANASTTYFANWDIEFQTQCWLIGG